MTFEEWGEPQHGVIDKVALIKAMYADWKAEREKLIGALEDALNVPPGNLVSTKARAVLQEVKEQK